MNEYGVQSSIHDLEANSSQDLAVERISEENTAFSGALRQVVEQGEHQPKQKKEQSRFRRPILWLMSAVVFSAVAMMPQVARTARAAGSEGTLTHTTSVVTETIQSSSPEADVSMETGSQEVLDLNQLGWELPFTPEQGQTYYITQGPTELTAEGLQCSIHQTHINLDKFAMDISLHLDHPVQSAQEGEVLFAGQMGPYGNTVILRHAHDGLLSQYSHLNSISEQVAVGTTVKKSQQIGGAGNTGSAGMMYHLHFAVLADTQFDFSEGNILDESFFQQVGQTVPVNYTHFMKWYGNGVLGSCSAERYEAEIQSSEQRTTQQVETASDQLPPIPDVSPAMVPKDTTSIQLPIPPTQAPAIVPSN